ncbi:MAG: hypothetical protein IJ597_03780 [Synergistaceae bacterium]|nr:hypothetical protein [Synergistaceae bacterium]
MNTEDVLKDFVLVNNRNNKIFVTVTKTTISFSKLAVLKMGMPLKVSMYIKGKQVAFKADENGEKISIAGKRRRLCNGGGKINKFIEIAGRIGRFYGKVVAGVLFIDLEQ